jgi:nitrile hydratase
MLQVVPHNPPKYGIGDSVKVSVRFPVGHYRVPMYVRGKDVTITRILGRYVNPEEEGFGKNAGNKLWCYLVTIYQHALWPSYMGKENDRLEIEVFEPWLEHFKTQQQ